MAWNLNIDEVLEIAEQMEKKAGIFYRRAAKLQKSKSARALLERLAGMEDDHRKVFAAMRKQSVDITLQDEAALYLQAISDAADAEGSPRATAGLTGREPLPAILTYAVAQEKKAILYYVGLHESIQDKATVQLVDRIISEEKSHVVSLTAELNSLG
jgi:rubrerythrin